MAHPNSKRLSLNRLAPDWREAVFRSIKSPRLKDAVAVLSAVGCRPAELEKGIAISIRNNRLILGIVGAKVNPETGRGQPVRAIYIDQTTPWGEYLFSRAKESTMEMTIRYDAGGVSQRLREKSRELWPRRKTLVSAYSYRHFIGKSMKESGEPPEKIAMTLGHASDFSQTVYGRAGGSKKTSGMHGIILAVTKNPVRHSAKLDKLMKHNSRTTHHNSL